MAAFNAAHPRIELNISISMTPADFAADRVDVDIRFGQPESAGLRVEPFLSSARFRAALEGQGVALAYGALADPTWPPASW